MLTTKEQEYGNQLLGFNNSPVGDKKKVNDFIYADDKGKIIMIKEFLSEVIEPQKDQDLNVYQEKVDSITAEKVLITDYTKVAIK